MIKSALAIVCAFAISTSAAAQTAPPETVRPISASKIILVGDSTTAVQGGWGPSFCAHHVTSFLACVNLARGGRSSSSYRVEGSWDLALAEMRTPGFRRTWVLIQFGHNDQPGKPGRSTDLVTEFPVNIRRYVDEVRAAGGEPILLTPLTRRTFEHGALQNDLEPWAQAIRRVAAEANVPLLDLNALSAAAVQDMGEDAANRFAQAPPGTTAEEPTAQTETNDRPFARPRVSFDRTHLGREGADYFAAMVTRELGRIAPELRPMLVE